MGNKNCEVSSPQIQQNQAYGEFEIIQEHNQQFAKIVKVVELQKDLKSSIISSLKKRSRLKLEGLCQLYSFEIQQSQAISQVILKYQYLSNSLFNKKQTIFSSNQRIPQEQLIKLMDIISKTLKELYNDKMIHGCVNFNTILCTQNSYKITDISSTSYLTLMELVQRGQKNQPISKKIINYVNEGQIKDLIRHNISIDDDLFSLGMIILCLGTRTQVSQFYTFSKKQQKIYVELKDDVIDDYLYLLRKRYSKSLQKNVRELLYPRKKYTQHSFSKSRDNLDIETHQNSNYTIDAQQQN